MPYEVRATSKTPALLVYLLDCSSSMGDPFDGARRIDHVNEAIEKVLIRMVQRSTKGEIISPRYRLAMIAYSDRPQDILGGIETITNVAQRGKPRLSPMALTDTASAFLYARDLLRQELPKLDGYPAPMVIHLTDGQFNGADPEPIAKEIMQMSNSDGNVLIENVFIGPDLTHSPITKAETWVGISSVDELKDSYAKMLFNMSSPLPPTYSEVIQEEGYALKPGARMLIPGANKDLIELAFTMSGATPTT